MSKHPTPKGDRLREMREARYSSAKIDAPAVADLREKVAAIPAKKPPKPPKPASAA